MKSPSKYNNFSLFCRLIFGRTDFQSFLCFMSWGYYTHLYAPKADSSSTLDSRPSVGKPSDLVELEPTTMPFADICSTTEQHFLTFFIIIGSELSNQGVKSIK